MKLDQKVHDDKYAVFGWLFYSNSLQHANLRNSVVSIVLILITMELDHRLMKEKYAWMSPMIFLNHKDSSWIRIGLYLILWQSIQRRQLQSWHYSWLLCFIFALPNYCYRKYHVFVSAWPKAMLMYFVLSQCQLYIGFAISLRCQFLSATPYFFLSANVEVGCAAMVKRSKATLGVTNHGLCLRR